MLIAKNLKRLRLDMGLTQEDLAERVGVTGQAVSKWERDECYPDITLLPGLANCFDVTVDELLGMAEIKGKMWGVYAQANTLQVEGKYHDAVAIYDKALKTFPADLGLSAARAEALAMAGKGIDYTIEMCERRLDDDLSDHSRSGVVAVLCFLYRRAGMLEKAELLARRRPHARDSREFLLPNFLAQPERDSYLREHLPGILTVICEIIDGDIGTDEEHLRQTILGIYRAPVPPAKAAMKITKFLTES
jgi:transcriptional regulator with XRE-family HTH domain